MFLCYFFLPVLVVVGGLKVKRNLFLWRGNYLDICLFLTGLQICSAEVVWNLHSRDCSGSAPARMRFAQVSFCYFSGGLQRKARPR